MDHASVVGRAPCRTACCRTRWRAGRCCLNGRPRVPLHRHAAALQVIPVMTTNALTRRSVLGGAAALALPSLIGRAAGQEAVDLAAAKKEGRVVVYTSAPLAAAQKI